MSIKKAFLYLVPVMAFLPTVAAAAEATISGSLPSFASSVPVYGPGGFGPIAIVRNFYFFSLMIGGVLAFAVMFWEGIKYMTAGGSHSTMSSARERGTGAFLGLLLLGGGAFLGLRIINPDLTALQIAFMERLTAPTPSEGPIFTKSWGCIDEDDRKTVLGCYISSSSCARACSESWNPLKDDGFCQESDLCQPTSSTGGGEWGCEITSPTGKKTESSACFPTEALCKTSCDAIPSSGVTTVCKKTSSCTAAAASGNCKAHQAKYPGSQCVESKGVKEVVACVSAAQGPAPSATVGGVHNINSCHFGGKACKDGGHAIDYGINGSAPRTLREVASMVATCATSTKNAVQCFYENSRPKGKETIRRDENGALYASTDARVDHLHCNVNIASCLCN